MQNLTRCVLQGLTYIQYATALHALRVRTCVCKGGTSSAAFSTGLVAKDAPCRETHARCAPLVYI